MWTALTILLFLALSGSIAYVGDLLGRRLGKKRLTLFGLRPKHTAIVLTTVTGVVIAAGTFLAAMATVPGFRRAVMESERLSAQARSLAREIVNRSAESRRLIQENESLGAENKRLEAQNERLAVENRGLEKARRELERAKQDLTARNAGLQASNETLTRDNAALRAQRDVLSQDTQSLRQEEYIYRRGDVIRVRILPTNPPRDVLDDVVAGLLYEVQVDARERGAAPHRGLPVTYLVPPLSHTGPVPTQSRLQADLQAAAARIRNRPVAILALADRNCVRGRPVPVRLEAYANEIVYSRGEEIARRAVDGTATEGFIMGQIIQLLQGGVRAAATAPPRRMIPTERGLGEISYDAMLELCRRVRRVDGPAVVIARARQDTMRVGRLTVDFDVQAVDRP